MGANLPPPAPTRRAHTFVHSRAKSGIDNNQVVARGIAPPSRLANKCKCKCLCKCNCKRQRRWRWPKTGSKRHEGRGSGGGRTRGGEGERLKKRLLLTFKRLLIEMVDSIVG